MHSGQSKPGAAPLGENVFRREGQYWTIAYSGTVVRLRDTKGLRCLACLLRHPGERISPRALMQQPEIGEPGLGAGNQEPETRDQKPFTDERARVAVTKRIKSAIHRIQEHYPALGYHLSVTIKTGSHCVYLADPERPIVWME